MTRRVFSHLSRSIALAAVVSVAGCASSDEPELSEIPAVIDYCLAAQQLVTRTDYRVEVVIHDDFNAFVKSKALIEGPVIQQFNWLDSNGEVAGISCKLKSADHLNLEFGEGTAGPDGLCQDMNRAVFSRVVRGVSKPAFSKVVFDPNETVVNEEQPGMTGPDWLAPYVATSVDEEGTLTIRTKGFIVDFTDPQYAKAPPRFRGVHYCHFIAPDHLRALMAGSAEPGLSIGQLPETMSRGD